MHAYVHVIRIWKMRCFMNWITTEMLNDLFNHTRHEWPGIWFWNLFSGCLFFLTSISCTLSELFMGRAGLSQPGVTASLEEESGDHGTSSLKKGEAYRANGLSREGPRQADPTKDLCWRSPGEDNEGHQVNALEFKSCNSAKGTGAKWRLPDRRGATPVTKAWGLRSRPTSDSCGRNRLFSRFSPRALFIFNILFCSSPLPFRFSLNLWIFGWNMLFQ